MQDCKAYLSEAQIQQFHEIGYLVIPNFWDDVTINTLRGEIQNIIATNDLNQVKSIFTTGEKQRQHTDDYFLNSGHNISFFWEEKAWRDGELIIPKEVAINKIGHALHDLVPEFHKVSYEKRVGQICRDLGLQRPLAIQSMYIFKQAQVGGEVVPHQDGAFLYTEPQSVIGFWWALDDCTISNGSLWAVPGSHILPVTRRFRRRPDGTGTEFIPAEPVKFDIEGAVPLEVARGTLVLLHSSVVHFSADNRSTSARHAYSIHVVEGDKFVVYPPDNWLQKPKGVAFNEIIA